VAIGIELGSTYSRLSSSAATDNAVILPFELGFDWKFLERQLLSLSYESGVTTSTGQNGNNNLATGGTFSIGYGYTF
jgi:hypothetical protein